MKYHDYIWDLGGTLLDNYESSTRAFCETLKSYHIEATHDEVYEALKVSTDHAIRKFVPAEPDFRAKYKRLEAKYLDRPILFDGALVLLETIIETGSRNFLISHRDNHVLEILEKTGIVDYFTEVVTSENGFARKPNPESILYLKHKYDIEHGLVIGDRDIDLLAGQAADFETYLVENSHSIKALLEY